MSLRRHVLQVVALVTAVALVFGAFAGSAGAKKLNKSQKAKIRAELRKQVKKSPGAVKRRAFLRKAALVNFKLPVTIRLRNTCRAANNPSGVGGLVGGQQTTPPVFPYPAGPQAGQPTYSGGLNCATQGTALNQRTIPSAHVNLGPSLGSRDIAIGGSLSAVVEFNDTYDGGALGNVNIKIIQDGSKGLKTSSVPLLWNNDITRTGTTADANTARANIQPGAPVYNSVAQSLSTNGGYPASGAGVFTTGALAFVLGVPALKAGLDAQTSWADNAQQGCSDWTGTSAGVPNQTGFPSAVSPALPGSGYKALFVGAPFAPNGVPGYTLFNSPVGIGTSGGILPISPGVDNPANIQAGGVVGDNEFIGPNTFPFPTQTAPSTTAGGAAPGTGSGSPADYGNARDTVLRTNALTLDIAQGGQQVDMSTGQGATSGGITTAQGSQNITMGYSGGQANLFGNIPGKNVGIDVTVNLATKITSIARIMDQDVFKTPSLIQGEPYPAGIFNCRQIVTGAVQNYIPGVRLTGSLRIAPAITKDGKVRIAKATVSSDANNPDRVALSACLFPAKPYEAYNTALTPSASSDTLARRLPTKAEIENGTAGVDYFYVNGVDDSSGAYAASSNTTLPVNTDVRRWGAGTIENRTGPFDVKCGSGNSPELADLIKQSGLTGQVVALNAPNGAYTTQAVGVQQSHHGDQASVAGDITVNPIDVDVLLGDVPDAP